MKTVHSNKYLYSNIYIDEFLWRKKIELRNKLSFNSICTIQHSRKTEYIVLIAITQHRSEDHLPYFRIESFVLVRGVRLGDPSSDGRVLHHGGLVVLPSELGAVIVHVEDDDPDDARSGERRRAYEHAEKHDAKFQSCCRRAAIKTTAVVPICRSSSAFFYFLSFISFALLSQSREP